MIALIILLAALIVLVFEWVEGSTPAGLDDPWDMWPDHPGNDETRFNNPD